MSANQNELSNSQIIERLNSLEKRISQLESEYPLDSTISETIEEPDVYEQEFKLTSGSFIESKVGESGLAWLGNIVLFLGITFLEQYIQNVGYQIASSVFGYVSVVGIFIMAYFLKNSYPRMASIFTLNALLLLFYVTLRLHFFMEFPLIASKSIGLILLVLVTTIQLFISYRKKSLLLAWTGLILLSVIAVVSDTTHFILPMAVFIALVAVFFFYQFKWVSLIYLSIILAYSVTIIWFLNDPFMGHPIQAISSHQFGFIYLFAIAAIFSLVALVKKSESFTSVGIVASIILNGIGFTFVITLLSLSFFKENYMMLTASISVSCLLYSIVLKIKSEWKITAALYALYGFVTFSLTVYGIYDFPRAYFLLAIQSLLVVVMAIWFRSRFIVGMNTFLFIILLVFYLQTSSFIDGVNISFSLAALLTARILYWKQDQLNIKTDILRNIYLFIGVVMVLITLYHLMPDRYIALSWTFVAVIFFGMSFILKIAKYRYLALGTLIAAAFYLFIVDLAKIELVFRIIALMFFALISIGLSIYYTKKSKRKTEQTEP